MKKNKSVDSRNVFLGVIMLLGLGQPLHATTLTWDAALSGGNGGTGTWDTNTISNWYDGTADVVWPASGSANAAIFGGTAGTVTLSGNISANSLTFNTSGYTITNGTLTLNGSAPTITTSSGTASIASTIAGTAGLTRSGGGTLILAGSNSNIGAATLNSGTMAFQGTGSITNGHRPRGADGVASAR